MKSPAIEPADFAVVQGCAQHRSLPSRNGFYRADGPSNPGSQGNRPSDPGFFPEQRPVNPGPATGPSIAGDHQPEASSHAVDPTDTHGFKNYGLYVAATHVSDRLHVPLTDLKTEMETDGGSLGKAIHTLRPDLSSSEVDAEVKKAEAEAKKAEAEAKKNRS